ncbi:MAG: cobaltochelatase subunit CobN [Bryobacteraceae bacterium]|nr:MAG: cobaltochelatase subunit CobN [Bryobacteraceae bacterium]
MNRLRPKRLLMAAFCAALVGWGFWQWTRPRIAFLGFPGSYMRMLKDASDSAHVDFDYWTRKRMEDPRLPADALAQYKVIFVSGRRTDPLPEGLKAAIRQARKRGAAIIVIPSERARDLGVSEAEKESQTQILARYFEYGGAANMKGALLYAARHYLGRKVDPPPPLPTPESGYYHPDAAGPFEDTGSYLKWYRAAGKERPEGSRILIDFADGWKIGSSAGTDALIRAFEKSGWNVAAIFGKTRTAQFAREWKPDILLARGHGRWFAGPAGVDVLEKELNVPLLRGAQLFFSGETLAQYRESPAGLRGAALAVGVVVPELDGAIEPTLLEGLDAEWYGARRESILQDRVQRLMERAARWVKLRKTPNGKKKVAVIYFAGMGKGRITAAGLNVPESAIRLLRAMQQAGYDVRGIPDSAADLARILVERGRNISETQKGDLEDLAAQPGVELLPASDYEAWFRELPERLQRRVEDVFGPPPGRLMVLERQGRQYLVLPVVRFGNVLLMPQPPRSGTYSVRQSHDSKTPPPHHFLAAYWWLERRFAADALLHYGTHGTLEFLPGRPAGLLSDDWADVVLGRHLNVYVYVIDNPGEALMAKRRAMAVIVSHQTPPIIQSRLTQQDGRMADLARSTRQFGDAEPGAYREALRSRIRELAVQLRLDRDLGFNWSSTTPDDSQVAALEAHLHMLEEEKIPVGLHTHGVANTDQQLVPVIAAALGKDFEQRHGGAEGAQRRVAQVLQHYENVLHTRRPGAAAAGPVLLPVSSANRSAEGTASAAMQEERRIIALRLAFSETGQEIERTLHALEGGYVRPGPGGDPARNPGAVPTGRNLYGINPREVPTRAAWEIGCQLGRQLLERERKRLGRWPRKVGFTLWNTELIRQYGTDLAQILFLLGVRPVWNEQGLVEGVELIPAVELGRPRVDVVIQAASLFRDTFPDRMELLDEAVRKAAAARDGGNFVAENTAQAERTLKEAGLAPADARLLAAARIFSSPPGAYGTGVIDIAEKSGMDPDGKKIADSYLRRTGAVYTSGVEWGKEIEGLYRAQLQGTDAVTLSRSSTQTGALTLDHYFEFLGGMTAAVREATGKDPSTYLSDVRDPGAAGMIPVEQALRVELRTRIWNPAWLRAQQKEGFSGAVEVVKVVDNLYGWQVSKPASVTPDVWARVEDVLVNDSQRLGLREWFDQNNPWAWQSITAVLLESARQGYWKPSQEVLARVAEAYASSVARHGVSGDGRTTDNAALQSFVQKTLQALPGAEGQRLTTRWQDALTRSSGAAKALAVTGQRLAREAAAAPAREAARYSALAVVVVAALVVLLRHGFLRGREP